MKFKHTFNVFVDNFVVTYKLLLYRVIITLFSLCLYSAVILPFIGSISNTTEVIELNEAIKQFGTAFASLDFAAMQSTWLVIRDAFTLVMEMLGAMVGSIVLTVAIIVVVYLVQRFLLGLGNYTAGALINDRMAMHANSPFFGTLIKNLGSAALYNAIYVPLSFVYDLIFFSAVGGIVIGLMNANVPILLLIFGASTAIAFLYVIKMVFTTDWLPAIIYGKANNRKAIAYSFNYTAGGKDILSVLSNYVVLVLFVFAINVMAVVFTLGAGVLITMPASYVIMISFEFVNYCDNNEVKYFMDKNTIVKPNREQIITRSQFFKGEDDK